MGCFLSVEWLIIASKVNTFLHELLLYTLGALHVSLNMTCDLPLVSCSPMTPLISRSYVVPACRRVHLLSCTRATMAPWVCVCAEVCPGLSQTGLSVWAGAGTPRVQFCSWFALEAFTCSTPSRINRSGHLHRDLVLVRRPKT